MKVMVDSRLFQHPKLVRLADLLGRTSAETVGYLVTLWAWASEYRVDGSLADLSDREVALASGWRGRPAKFISAIRESGWLDGTQIHDWQEHQGAFIRKIIAERDRKRGWRSAEPDRTFRGRGADVPRENIASYPVPLPFPSPVPIPKRGGEEEPPLPAAPTSAPAEEFIQELGVVLHRDAAPGEPVGPDGTFEDRMARLWNGQGSAFPLAVEKARRIIRATVERGASKQAVEVALSNGPACAGRKLWEVLDPLIVKRDGNWVEELEAKFKSESRGGAR